VSRAKGGIHVLVRVPRADELTTDKTAVDTK
jgi:hypothetical protein